MRFDTIFPEPAHGEVIDPDGEDFGFGEEGRCLFGDVNEILVELVGFPGETRIAGLEKNPFSRLDSSVFDFFDRDCLAMSNFDHAGRSNGGFERHPVERFAVPEEMPGRIHVGPGVGAKRKSGDVANVPLFHIEHFADFDFGIIGPMSHARFNGDRDIDPFFRHDYYASAMMFLMPFLSSPSKSSL